MKKTRLINHLNLFEYLPRRRAIISFLKKKQPALSEVEWETKNSLLLS